MADLNRITLKDFENTVAFILWTDDKLLDRKICQTLFPHHTDGTDWDLGGPYNYIYHRYSGFHSSFVAFYENTPTFKKDILETLLTQYAKETGEKLDMPTANSALRIMTCFGNGSMPGNAQLKSFIKQTLEEKQPIFSRAVEQRISFDRPLFL